MHLRERAVKEEMFPHPERRGDQSGQRGNLREHNNQFVEGKAERDLHRWGHHLLARPRLQCALLGQVGDGCWGSGVRVRAWERTVDTVWGSQGVIHHNQGSIGRNVSVPERQEDEVCEERAGTSISTSLSTCVLPGSRTLPTWAQGMGCVSYLWYPGLQKQVLITAIAKNPKTGCQLLSPPTWEQAWAKCLHIA